VVLGRANRHGTHKNNKFASNVVLSIDSQLSILKYVSMLAYEVDLYQVSFSKNALSVLYGGLIGGRGAICFPGLDNKL
jgi:hypothetical protein